jgi:multiple sugar transport system permease protein/putative aldouronate transport system permease protein
MKKIRAYLKNESRRWQLYVLILIPFIYVIIFKYIPIYGIQIAFKNFSLTKGIIQSEWVGLKYFKIFFNSYQFSRVLTNTLAISIIGLIVSFPFPVLLALSLNQVQKRSFKKTVQMVTYAPHFISTVVLVGMVLQFLDTRSGFVNKFIGIFGIDSINFMANPNFFLPIYIFSGIWQNVGYGSIIF